MADVRTLKQGHLYVLSGAAEPIVDDTGVNTADGFVASDGTHVILYTKSGDLYRVTGNSFLSMSGAGSSVLNATYTIAYPVVYASGSDVHLWYAYDSAGGSAYTVYYAKSTDGGATWGTPAEVIALGTGGSWNDAAVRPVGVHDDGTTLTLQVLGNDGSNNKLGVWTATSGADYSLSGSYSANGSNPFGPALPLYTQVAHHRGAWHRFTANSATYLQTTVASCDDGTSWPSGTYYTHEQVFTVGESGSKDDALALPVGSYSDGRFLYLFYWGNDGSTSKLFCAVGEYANKLSKVAGFEVTALPSELDYCTGDLTYADTSRAQHIPDRLGPGALAEAMFEPFGGSFSYRLTTIPTAYNSPDPGVNDDGKTINLLYVLDDENGTAEQFALFPRALMSWDFAEAAEGDLVNASFMCYGTTAPILGEY